MDKVFNKQSESEYLEMSTPAGLEELKDSMTNGQQGGKKRARKAPAKKSSKKSSKKLSGGKRKSVKKASKKTSKKGSKKLSGGKKHSKKASKKTSKKASKKGSKRTAPKRTMPEGAKAFVALVKLISEDKDVPVKYNVAMRVAKAYKDDLTNDNKNMSSTDVINKAKKEYPGESAATKKKYLARAEKMIEDSKAAKKANKN
jgi:colicin import membrane protein